MENLIWQCQNTRKDTNITTFYEVIYKKLYFVNIKKSTKKKSTDCITIKNIFALIIQKGKKNLKFLFIIFH